MVPTLLDLLSAEAPEHIRGIEQQPIEGISFAATLSDADAKTGKQVQYFEMFGNRGIYLDGWKAVAFHAAGTPLEDDQWELFDLTVDFNEANDLAAAHPERLQTMIARWWKEAERYQVLPLDDRFAERFAENSERHSGTRTQFVFWRGMGHLPPAVAPDLRSRSYRITADVEALTRTHRGVLIAHGDATSGYSLYIDAAGHLVHDLNIGGSHQLLRSPAPITEGVTTLGFSMRRHGRSGTGELLIDGETVAQMSTENIFALMVSWSGLDIGLDRGTPVSHYASPNAFTGQLRKVSVDLLNDQDLDNEGSANVEIGRE